MSDASIKRLLRDVRNEVVGEAAAAQKVGDIRAKVSWEIRRSYLDGLIREFRDLSDDSDTKSVFISYSVNSGGTIFTYMNTLLRKAGLDVVTGFQQHPGDNDNVLKRVRSQLTRSDVYLGILTKELQVRDTDGTMRWAPSVWTMEEKGMALAMQKPFVLMVEEGIHNDFWRKTTPEKVHQIFNASNYMEVAEVVLGALVSRLEQKELRETVDES